MSTPWRWVVNTVMDYPSAGIEASQAAAPVTIHDDLITTEVAPGPGGSGGIAVFGQSVSWTGCHEIISNTLSGPAEASDSYGVWIDSFSGSTMDVRAELKNNDIHFFDVGEMGNLALERQQILHQCNAVSVRQFVVE